MIWDRLLVLVVFFTIVGLVTDILPRLLETKIGLFLFGVIGVITMLLMYSLAALLAICKALLLRKSVREGLVEFRASVADSFP